MPVDPYRTISKAPAENLIRLHIGLEEPDDLIKDLSAAFDQAGRSP
jgi:cystathionine beta-lyase